MTQVNVGEGVKVKFGTNAVIVDGVVRAKKPGATNVLVETKDGSIMIDALPIPSQEGAIQHFQADGFCHLKGGYTREKAARALGYKGVKLQ